MKTMDQGSTGPCAREHSARCRAVFSLAIAILWACTVTPPCAGAPVTFTKIVIDGSFRSEGVAVADVDRDGTLDILAGNIWYKGPRWKMHPMLGQPKAFEQKGYSDAFLCFADDINGDGWTDMVAVGFPGAQTRWLRNPGGQGGQWTEYLAVQSTGNESPWWGDLDGDGQGELVFVSKDRIACARPGADPTREWLIDPVSAPGNPAPGHGLGVADVTGDGRADIVIPDGYYAAPRNRRSSTWAFQPAGLGGVCAQMCVYDFDGDGDNDVLSSSAHAYGISWAEQTPQGWVLHEIDRSISQTHALHLADINRDGLMDFVTGKRYWAHNGNDPGANEPAVLCWFELQRKDGRPAWTKHQIDDNSGVGLHAQVIDINGDGLPDIVTSNKKGVHLFIQEASPDADRVARRLARRDAVLLFDGSSFDGWEGNLEFFRIEDGAIVAGSLQRAIPRNEFLCTTKVYEDFELRLKVKLLGDPASANAGIQIRSRRIPNHHEMIGYQADMGQHYWGCLYDESRRRTILAKPDAQKLGEILRAGDWNEYVIRCVGPRVQLWLNGFQTVDYTEPDPAVEQSGVIGLQVHGGPPTEAWYKDIAIKTLPRR